MPLLGLLWGSAGLTALGRYLLIAVAGLAFAGWAVSGITAPYKRTIAALEDDKKQLILAAEQKEVQIEASRKRYEDDLAREAALQGEIKRFFDASPVKSDACRLSPEQLQFLSSIAAR